jgi:hypothetical protein
MKTTTRTIESYVDTQPSIVKQAFSALLNNKSKATQDTISACLPKIKVWLNRAGVITVSKDNWIPVVFELFEIEPLMDIVTFGAIEESSSIYSKLVRAAIGWFIDPMIGYVLDLDLSELSREDQSLVGTGIALAALYKEAQKLTIGEKV